MYLYAVFSHGALGVREFPPTDALSRHASATRIKRKKIEATVAAFGSTCSSTSEASSHFSAAVRNEREKHECSLRAFNATSFSSFHRRENCATDVRNVTRHASNFPALRVHRQKHTVSDKRLGIISVT